jgi:hypothetical protein
LIPFKSKAKLYSKSGGHTALKGVECILGWCPTQHLTFWDVGCPRIHWFPNSWQKIILYTLFFCSWSIYVFFFNFFFFPFQFNFWNYMVDWYMLTVSN